MEQTPHLNLTSTIDRHRIATRRSYRNLADETLIPLSTLHRKMQTGSFTIKDLRRIALAFDVTPSELIAEAEQPHQDVA